MTPDFAMPCEMQVLGISLIYTLNSTNSTINGLAEVDPSDAEYPAKAMYHICNE
jgi:hypothetical protein